MHHHAGYTRLILAFPPIIPVHGPEPFRVFDHVRDSVREVRVRIIIEHHNHPFFDTLVEVTVLFVAAIGLSAVLATRRKKEKREIQSASLVLYTGCRFLFPLILLFGSYIFIHGHLTPGGGFQGGSIVASAFVLIYLGCRGKRVNKTGSKTVESLGGLVFIVIGLVGLAVGGHYFLSNYLPKGELNSLFSAGVIPIIYSAIGIKVGSELAGVIDHLVEESE